MADRALRTVASGYSFLEGPRWHEGRLWFSDFYTHTVNALADDGSVEVMAEVPARPSGLGWLPDGRLLVVSMLDRKVMRQAQLGRPELVEHADLSAHTGGPANDMVVDANGRAYVSNFGYDFDHGESYRPTTVVGVHPDGTAFVAADGVAFPNGMVITPDGQTLIVNELMNNCLTAFTIAADGTLSGRRPFADFGDLGDEPDMGLRLGAATIVPDGSTLDADGAVWIADAAHNRAVRIADGGEILDQVETPEPVFAVALGGANGRTLYLCVAPGANADERTATRLGRLLATEVDVAHAGRP
jgi:sugar lactone lactonase YvrE